MDCQHAEQCFDDKMDQSLHNCALSHSVNKFALVEQKGKLGVDLLHVTMDN